MISSEFVLDRTLLLKEKRELSPEQWDGEIFPKAITTAGNKPTWTVVCEISELVMDTDVRSTVTVNYKQYAPYHLVDFRVQSESSLSLSNFLFRLAKVEMTNEERIDPNGKVLASMVGPADASSTPDPYNRPKLSEELADTLLEFILRPTKQENVPIVAWIAMAQITLLRLKSNRKQCTKLRKEMIKVCKRDFERYATSHEAPRLCNALNMYNQALMIRLGHDEPYWGVFHTAVLLATEVHHHDQIDDIFHLLWNVVAAVGLRPREERLDPIVLLEFLEAAIVDCAKVGLYFFFKRGQLKLDAVSGSASDPTENLFETQPSTAANATSATASLLPSPSKKSKKVELVRTSSIERASVLNKIDLMRANSLDNAKLLGSVQEEQPGFLSLPYGWETRDLVDFNFSRPEVALVCTICWSHFTSQDPPITFGDGKSVCRGCVSKKRGKLAQSEKMQALDKVFNWELDEDAKPLSEIFGASCDVTLGRIVQFTEQQSMVSTDEKEAARLRRLGNSLYRQAKYAEALKIYDEVLLMRPDSAVIYSNRSACFLKLGRRDEAKQNGLKALQLTEGRWGKAYHRIFAAESIVSMTRGARKRLAIRQLIAGSEDEEGKALSEEEYLRQYRNRAALVEEEEIEAWLKCSDETAIRTFACLTRASVLGEHLENQLRKACRSFLLADCTRFDKILSEANGDPDKIRPHLESLRANSLLLKLGRELVQCTDLENLLKYPPPLIATAAIPEQAKQQLQPQSLQSCRNDLDCNLCYSLLCEPTTLPCGHSFCKSCAIRAMDHSSVQQGEATCPMCRFPLGPYLDSLNDMAYQMSEKLNLLDIGLQHLELNRALDGIIRFVFPEEYASRLESTKLEEAPVLHSATTDPMETDIPFIPYDVPLLSTMVNSLILWEPSERLMIRRLTVMNSRQGETTNPADISMLEPDEVGHMTATRRAKGRFGICWDMDPDKTGFPSKYGVMQQIDALSATSDGGLVVTCTGKQRFELLREGSRDGYKTARVKLLEIDIHKYHLPDDQASEWLRTTFKDKNEVNGALLEAREKRYVGASEELLTVALERHLSLVKDRHPRYLDVVEHELCCLSSAPYYIATILSFPHQLQYYLMFGPETINSFWYRVKFILLLSSPNGDSFSHASLSSVSDYADVFPGLKNWPIGEGAGTDGEEDDEDDEDDEDEEEDEDEDEDEDGDDEDGDEDDGNGDGYDSYYDYDDDYDAVQAAIAESIEENYDE